MLEFIIKTLLEIVSIALSVLAIYIYVCFYFFVALLILKLVFKITKKDKTKLIFNKVYGYAPKYAKKIYNKLFKNPI